jgi:hypothetical protein
LWKLLDYVIKRFRVNALASGMEIDEGKREGVVMGIDDVYYSLEYDAEDWEKHEDNAWLQHQVAVHLRPPPPPPPRQPRVRRPSKYGAKAKALALDRKVRAYYRS